MRSSAPGNASVIRSIEEVGADGASVSSLRSTGSSTTGAAAAGFGGGRGLAVDDEPQRNRSTEMRGQHRLDFMAALFALRPMGSRGEREDSAALVGGEEPTRGVERLDHPLQLREHDVGPGDGELVA